MTQYLIPYVTARKTRFPELGFARIKPGLWRIVALDSPDDDGWHGGGTFGAIGPWYHSKDELRADLPRYAAEYGCEGA